MEDAVRHVFAALATGELDWADVLVNRSVMGVNEL